MSNKINDLQQVAGMGVRKIYISEKEIETIYKIAEFGIGHAPQINEPMDRGALRGAFLSWCYGEQLDATEDAGGGVTVTFFVRIEHGDRRKYVL